MRDHKWAETAENRAEEGLLDPKAHCKLLVDAVADRVVYTLDTQGNVASWNRGAERVTGYKESDALGKNFSCFFTEKDVRAGIPYQLLADAWMHGRTEVEGWQVRHDGSRYWASTVITALRGPSGELQGFGAHPDRVVSHRSQLRRLLGNETPLEGTLE